MVWNNRRAFVSDGILKIIHEEEKEATPIEASNSNKEKVNELQRSNHRKRKTGNTIPFETIEPSPPSNKANSSYLNFESSMTLQNCLEVEHCKEIRKVTVDNHDEMPATTQEVNMNEVNLLHNFSLSSETSNNSRSKLPLTCLPELPKTKRTVKFASISTDKENIGFKTCKSCARMMPYDYFPNRKNEKRNKFSTLLSPLKYNENFCFKCNRDTTGNSKEAKLNYDTTIIDLT